MSDGQMSDGAVDAFWADARVRVNLNAMRVYTGPNVLEAIRPPAWSFGGTPELADELLDLVLSGRKTATASALRDYQAEDEDPPSTGSLSIITDGSGQPRALICTTQVRVVPFDEVDEEHARAEGEGDLSLAFWRDVHQACFASEEHGPVTPDTEIVLERFKVIHQAR